ncbi:MULTISPECIES: energy-coupling factor transporter ATPase [Exiguobacterium]|uniref:Energy-coupling factor transporter ATP-binding protein EcfA2 n=1 Tax=Exiguobacterium antarcticum TaxID=132920 RepID=A0ABT6R412_9BACL|nr:MULTISPECIES: energy-coupling factor transporter ATPase [Exiguobacterium]AFS69291.1 Energy-coupling factor transporter ATP-binding protein EcfA2 [Exiguobacterium antarcticum B7]MCT4780743.1 energy-coupling factor transporter ATPase [Exiguobacterium soli]MDI3235687.1 energy-coupling factor transporter ATPase [Exiguobacterium antarcticum]
MPILIQELNYTYQLNSPFERVALRDVNLEIPSGALVAFVGHTGSGKSTLVQHINGLLKPTAGKVQVDDIIIEPKRKQDLKALRKRVGLVFQYPEYQLFEETVLKDVMFGPMNFGHEPSEAERLAKDALRTVGLDEVFWSRSPFDLSGGQMRRVAIAGVLASQPDVLIVDEPTAGLDPQGRKQMLRLFAELHAQSGMTLLLITHDMDQVLEYTNRVVVMEDGQVAYDGEPMGLFRQETLLRQFHLDLPHVLAFAWQMADQLNINRPTLQTEAELIEWILHVREGRR